ncbi:MULTISPECIES: hypothetical protein [unclassified Mucilaginibacter]|uniref:hypothetical protein n=1 Tax=unclassified Mucilaginibacter TaxID=2617802 RepID=UPI002AC9DF3E|nr:MULTISPECIES: hypothetical protein [unclassified Mucilaginibacter]MEB0262938.1 hypothetical protein [Mucilaginibacter sp. 10I4]MEB0278213.1 hypothetical protein [Mucilaginibacter sp. 10B2]MEB0302497.1 hypothetical protein [Mucilaginibacter sp. 5C4]WPX23859.1 hypothetical protein RHM67_01010 [Mucilaginibacter sp. 5C4]
MKKKQATFPRNILVLALVAMYFFTASTHIFFIPCLTQGTHHAALSHNSIFKRKLEYRAVAGNQRSFIQRPDKSIFEERKAVSDSIRSFLSFFTILLFIPLAWRLRPKFFANVSDHLYPPLHSYLSLCVIRI